MEPPEEWYGKSIRQLELRNRYGLNVIALRKGDNLGINLNIDEPINEEHTMVVLGSYTVINKLKKT